MSKECLVRSVPHPGAGLSNCGAPGRSQCLEALRAVGAASGCQLERLWRTRSLTVPRLSKWTVPLPGAG